MSLSNNWDVFKDPYEDFLSSVPKTDKTVVLDIDQTLVCTYENTNTLEKIYNERNPDDLDIIQRMYVFGKGDDYFCGLYRPHLEPFIKFCFKYFQNVIVWSAGTRDYVNAVCKFIFKNTSKPRLVWARDECEFPQGDTNSTKPLSKVSEKMGIPIEKMYLVDDMWYNHRPNADNGIYIPGYDPERCKNTINVKKEKMRENDDILPRLQRWFLLPHVAGCDDVRSLYKQDIFVPPS